MDFSNDKIPKVLLDADFSPTRRWAKLGIRQSGYLHCDICVLSLLRYRFLFDIQV